MKTPSEKKDVCFRGGRHGTGLPIETTKVICKTATAIFVSHSLYAGFCVLYDFTAQQTNWILMAIGDQTLTDL